MNHLMESIDLVWLVTLVYLIKGLLILDHRFRDRVFHFWRRVRLFCRYMLEINKKLVFI